MFRSSTIIRELALNLAKVILIIIYYTHNRIINNDVISSNVLT